MFADWFQPLGKKKPYDMRQNKQVLKLNQQWLVFITADSIVDSCRLTCSRLVYAIAVLTSGEKVFIIAHYFRSYETLRLFRVN